MERKERLFRAYKYLEMNGLIVNQEDLSYKMGASRSNISSALSGRESVLTDRFLRRFSHAFPGVFNLDWLLYEQGEMLLQTKKPEPSTPTDAIITLAATLIQETEALRRQLRDELSQVTSLRQELTATLAFLRTNFSTPSYPSTFPSTHYLAESPDDKINV